MEDTTAQEWLQSKGWDWYNTEFSARRVAELALEDIKEAFEAGTHWKEKYFKEENDMKIPDVEEFLAYLTAIKNK